ncbi:transglycosylase domain-containing protein [Rubritalea spongiae]|uniref:Transglycosylase domain-containing protein n=1 Tax=Rubritalea spongiae TaxID=430797 RepID=A0ABW5E4A9_9BACT
MNWKSEQNSKSPMTSWMPEWLQLCVRVAIRLFILGLIIFLLIAGYYGYRAQQFNLDKVAEQQQQNVLLDTSGLQLQLTNAKFQDCITQDDLPPHLIDALIAREDTNFQTHCGVDFKGLIRATLRNIKDMSFTQGASTLSMQLARNTYDIRAKSIDRKLLEIALTLRIEQHYNKEQIMAFYLNRIYFGSGCYGVEQASQKYFSKPTKDLNISESATLVGIIRGPHIFSPLRNLPAAQEQRDQVLDRMVDIGRLSPAEAKQIEDTPLTLHQSDSESADTVRCNPYAMKALDRHLQEILAEKDVREGALTIQTTLSQQSIETAQQDIDQLLSENGDQELQVACVILNHATGAIHCIIGGKSYTHSPFNRALDSKIDLGNAFTPFIYAAALERSKPPIKGQPAQTGKQLDPNDMVGIAKRFGFKGPFNSEEIFYGSATCTPLELATAYATLANEGKRPHTYYIQEIKNRQGESIFKNTPSPKPAIQPGSAKATLDLLNNFQGITSHSTTAFGGRALWSMAKSGDLTAVLWLGYDQPEPVPNSSELIRKMRKITHSWVN